MTSFRVPMSANNCWGKTTPAQCSADLAASFAVHAQARPTPPNLPTSQPPNLPNLPTSIRSAPLLTILRTFSSVACRMGHVRLKERHLGVKFGFAEVPALSRKDCAWHLPDKMAVGARRPNNEAERVKPTSNRVNSMNTTHRYGQTLSTHQGKRMLKQMRARVCGSHMFRTLKAFVDPWIVLSTFGSVV